MPPKEKYTDPELREEVKEELKQSDKGGAPGQWSARKAQMMASEYKKRGGDYNTDKSQKDESQKNLSKWGEEDWQTKEGSGNAKKEDGTEKRYLPKKAWEKMTDEEKQATEDKKQEGSKEGKQFVDNTPKAKQSRKKANKEAEEKEEDQGEGDDGNDDEPEDAGHDEDEYQDDDEHGSDEAGDDANDPSDGVHDEHDGEDAKAGDKRKKAGSQSRSNGKTKKQKSDGNSKGGNAPPGKVGSKHMDAEEPAPRGSADRLPKKGQKIVWKAMPGYVDGEVKEVLTKGKKVDGKDVKASKDDPKIVMKSNSSGKICVHKPDACFYD